jgi:hypothetical protein
MALPSFVMARLDRAINRRTMLDRMALSSRATTGGKFRGH